MTATAVWRDEMQGVARSQGLFSLTRDTTRQFARQTPSHTGCGQIGCSLPCTAWCQSPSYDLRRTRRDLPDLTRNAVHGGINQRFLKGYSLRKGLHLNLRKVSCGGGEESILHIAEFSFVRHHCNVRPVAPYAPHLPNQRPRYAIRRVLAWSRPVIAARLPWSCGYG